MGEKKNISRARKGKLEREWGRPMEVAEPGRRGGAAGGVGLVRVYLLRRPQPGPAEAPLPTRGGRGREGEREPEGMNEVNQVLSPRINEQGR